MGEDQAIDESKLPKHLQKYKQIEKRKQWLREYHLKRYHEKHDKQSAIKEITKPEIKMEEKIMEATPQAAPKQGDISDKDFAKIVEEFQNITDTKDDPLINGVKKYGPLVMMFIKGFAENAQAHQQQ
ncbi:MAG: hypothetical protein WC900_04570, partial [Oscillospiraceae bacterium]